MRRPLAQLTHDELIALFYSCPKDEEKAILAEIERRIRVKNNRPHDPDCQCTDCMGIVSEDK